MKLLTETRNNRGRTTDDRRSVVQSIVLALLPSPNYYEGRKPSYRAMAPAVGLPQATYRKIVKAVTDKRVSLESTIDDEEIVYSQVLKSKGRRKSNGELQKK